MCVWGGGGRGDSEQKKLTLRACQPFRRLYHDIGGRLLYLFP